MDSPCYGKLEFELISKDDKIRRTSEGIEKPRRINQERASRLSPIKMEKKNASGLVIHITVTGKHSK